MEISRNKLIIAFVLIFLLGILFSIANGYYTEETGTQLPAIFYVSSILSLIIGALLVLLFEWKINKVHLERVLKILPEDERKIVSLLLENNNSLEQNKLVALTGIHKVKMSRILSDFEFRGLIKRNNLGNTKLIILNV